MSNKKFMPRANQRRLLKDVADIMKHPLTDNGIHYAHDEDDMFKGYALVFGPSDTIYRYGSYLFIFNFPSEYPFVPPSLSYMTNDGQTRFNPNLYRNGKVCLSILNTWKGEQWTSCQSIRSVLMTLVTLLHNNPLTNEPGIRLSNPNVKPYNLMIQYKNYEVAILGILTQKTLPAAFINFYHIIKQYIRENKTKIMKELRELSRSKNNKTILKINIYNMGMKLDYSDLYERIKLAFEQYL